MKLFSFAAAVTAAVLFAGCSGPQLAIGEYRSAEKGKEDFIVAYQDMAFLQIRAPQYAPGSLEYWNWAGKYSITDAGEIVFDMDRETAKRWNFYYTFLRRRDGIVVNDLSSNKGYLLKYRIPRKRAGAQPGFIPTGSTGTEPNYAPVQQN